MYRRLFKIAVMTITILTANLVTSALSDYMVSYRMHFKPITFTLIGMAIITIVFYPLFTKLEDWINVISSKVVKTGKSFAGKYVGLLFTFLLCFAVLFYFYAKIWYNIDMIGYLLHLIVN